VFFIYLIKFFVNKYFIIILNERRGIFDNSEVGYELQTAIIRKASFYSRRKEIEGLQNLTKRQRHNGLSNTVKSNAVKRHNGNTATF